MTPLRNAPVIVGVGELADRPPAGIGREPARLMADALQLAVQDIQATALPPIDALDIVGEVSWPYDDAAAIVSAMAGIAPLRSENGPVGGQTPIHFLHRAALRIQAGEVGVAAICGAEAESSVRRAARDGVTPDWTPRADGRMATRAGDAQRPLTRMLEAAVPANVYPLYENATRAAWGQDWTAAQAETTALWAGLSALAATRPAAWQAAPVDAAAIGAAGPDNRPIAWPYLKRMVANPVVNQGAAVLLTGYGTAVDAGIDPARLIFVRGGLAAAETDDLLLRSSFADVPAMRHVLNGAQSIAEGDGPVELYSCFPVVPKLARRVLGRGPNRPISVTGGLPFFGAPLNNYMTHATVAMVQRMRAGSDSGSGLLYGQGGYLTKHHALVLSAQPGDPLAERDVAAVAAPVFTGQVLEDYVGPARIETFTILFERDTSPRHGIVIARTPDDARLLAKVAADDDATLAALTDRTVEPVGLAGLIQARDDIPHFTIR